LAKPRHNILILNGPNLGQSLGIREPELYGFKDFATLVAECEEYGSAQGFRIDFRQSNHEGELVTFIQEAREEVSGLIINAGAYTHTSIAILDALKMLDVPVIEVHITNIQKREEYRRHSYVAQAATGTICGFGGHGYILALDAMRALLEDEE
jgi:3-dehydroquinate dehydratase-2